MSDQSPFKKQEQEVQASDVQDLAREICSIALDGKNTGLIQAALYLALIDVAGWSDSLPEDTAWLRIQVMIQRMSNAAGKIAEEVAGLSDEDIRLIAAARMGKLS